MARPGRKPTDLRKLDLKLEFDTDEDGQRVRDLGGGPWVLSLINAALAHIPADPVITELVNRGGNIEIRVSIPAEKLQNLTGELARRQSRRDAA